MVSIIRTISFHRALFEQVPGIQSILMNMNPLSYQREARSSWLNFFYAYLVVELMSFTLHNFLYITSFVYKNKCSYFISFLYILTLSQFKCIKTHFAVLNAHNNVADKIGLVDSSTLENLFLSSL